MPLKSTKYPFLVQGDRDKRGTKNMCLNITYKGHLDLHRPFLVKFKALFWNGVKVAIGWGVTVDG